MTQGAPSVGDDPRCPVPGRLKSRNVDRRLTEIVRILRASAPAYSAPVAALTGRLDPTPDVAAAGAWKEARWGLRSRRPWRPIAVAACRSNVVRCDGLNWWNKAPQQRSGGVEPSGSGGAETRTGPQIAERGCRKVAHITYARLPSRHPRPVLLDPTIAARERQERTARARARADGRMVTPCSAPAPPGARAAGAGARRPWP